MRLLLVSDTYPPARISGALQMRDLAHALVQQGHRPLVLTPALRSQQAGLEEIDGVQVLRVQAPRTKDVAYWRRTLAESVLPWLLLRGLRRSGLVGESWDGLVWYSPTIFLGPLVWALKKRLGCPAYLIVRDLFPDWAVDAGVMRKGGLAYRLFKAVERFQYRQADVIGVQTPSNVALVARDTPKSTRIEVLHNWLAPPPIVNSVEAPDLGPLEGRTNFIYAGNMGVAQDMDAFVDLAIRMAEQDGVGFVFVGRGSEAERLKATSADLANLKVLGEMDPAHLPALLNKCHVGIVALHPAHATHNIPGKLLTYLHAGMPVLARVNPSNDLVEFIQEQNIGLVVPGDNPGLLHAHAYRLVADAALRQRMGESGRRLGQALFSPGATAAQVVMQLTSAGMARRS